MVKSTQSVSWPKRDGIYSVLRHLGPFACIITVLCSEDPTLSKTRLEVIFQLNVSTGHPVQFSGGFAIFQRPQYVWCLWKISKKHKIGEKKWNCCCWHIAPVSVTRKVISHVETFTKPLRDIFLVSSIENHREKSTIFVVDTLHLFQFFLCFFFFWNIHETSPKYFPLSSMEFVGKSFAVLFISTAPKKWS